MAKSKSVFVCNSCGYESAKWLGKCPGCNEWNTFFEEKISKASSSNGNSKNKVAKPLPLNSLEGNVKERTSTGFEELDRVLGGGLVKRFFNIIRRRTRNWQIYINFTNL